MRINRHALFDVGMLALTAGMGALAVVTPTRHRRRVVGGVVSAQQRLRRERPIKRRELAETAERREQVMERRRTARALRIEEAFCGGYGMFRRGWPADVDVTGIENLVAAHDEGRGVVVWQMTFLDLTPVFLAMADAGHPVSHLSTAPHRLRSSNKWCVRYVAPALARGEERALRERVVMTSTRSRRYIERLRQVLDEGGTVSIRGDFTPGRRRVEAMHLGQKLSFPTGAPSLAFRTGAPLLTAAVVRRGLLHHEVIIDEPIAVSRELDRRRFQEEAVAEYARRLDDRARHHLDSRMIVPLHLGPDATWRPIERL